MKTWRAARVAVVAALLVLSTLPAIALEIVFRDTTPGGMAAPARGAFQQAAALWSSWLADPVTVHIDIAYRNDGNNSILGSARSTFGVASYADVRGSLTFDALSAADRSAVSSLNAGAGFAFLATNLDGTLRADTDTNACPTTGPSVPCRNNNQNLQLTSANAKALGFDVATSSTSPDARISFNAFFDPLFDFDRSDGIAAGRYDFVSTAAHEIAHALGFVSGIDDVDRCIPALNCGLDNRHAFERFAVYTPLDLFRYSPLLGVRDLRVGAPAGLSIDGGRSFVEMMSTGRRNGDGNQASHFIAGPANLMNPMGILGRSVDPGVADLTALDVIGWDVVTPVPEPGTWALMLLGLGLVLGAARQRVKQVLGLTAH